MMNAPICRAILIATRIFFFFPAATLPFRILFALLSAFTREECRFSC